MVYQANPFTPTFGRQPYELAGRTELIDDVVYGLSNQPGDPNRATIFIGPRGSGKTVLLDTIAAIAEEMGWIQASVSAHDGMLREIASQLHTKSPHPLSEEVRSYITSVQAGPIGITRSVEPVETTWRTLLTGIVSELNEQGVAVLFVVDEVDPKCEELIRLVEIFQHFVREERDVALLLGGLPSKVSALLMDDYVSFVRRAFQRPLEPIMDIDVAHALKQTIQGNGRDIEPDALEMAVQAARGFAFAIQLVGYYLWRDGGASGVITAEEAKDAIKRAQLEFERSIVQPTLRDLTVRESEFLNAMVLDEGPSRTSVIASRMGISLTNAANLRKRLIAHGIINDIHLGEVEFLMPQLKDYLREHTL